MASLSSILSPEAIRYFQYHPLEFMELFILAPKSAKDGIEYAFTPQQREFIDAILNNRRVIVKAGRGTGKSMLLSCIAIWFCVVFPESKVFFTGVSEGQLKSAIFSEVLLWLSSSSVADLFTTTETRIYMSETMAKTNSMEIKVAPKGSPTSLSGLHAVNMLIIADEIFGIPDENLGFLSDSLTSGWNNKMIGAGNPTTNMGFAAEIFKKKAKAWARFTMDANDSPVADKQQIAEILEFYGEDSNKYRSSVLGEFPKADSDAFIGLERVEGAFRRESQGFGDIEVACDVARFGDDKTVCMWRWGYKVYFGAHSGSTDTFDIVNIVLDTVKKARAKTGYTGSIKVKLDCTGGWAAGPYDVLNRDRENNIELVEVNFGKGASNKEKYNDLPTEMWAATRSAIDKIDLPSAEDNPRLSFVLDRMKHELAARRMELTPRGVEKVESKQKYKDKYKHSPDFADTVIMLFANVRSGRSVIKNFDPVDERTVINQASYMSTSDEYVSVFYSRDRLASIVICKYLDGKLVVVSEIVTDDNLAMVASFIKRNTSGNLRKIIGNDKCFNKHSKDDVKGQLKRVYNVNLKRNKKYDELGATELFNELTASKNFSVLKRCSETINQVSNWQMNKSQIQLETEFGLCYAIINLISELRDQIKPRQQSAPRMRTPYAPVGERGDGFSLNKVQAGAYL